MLIVVQRMYRRRIFQHHPEVEFKPGPFYMGDGILGWAVRIFIHLGRKTDPLTEWSSPPRSI